MDFIKINQTLDRLYCGDPVERQGMIDAIRDSLDREEARLHLVSGGTDTGKSSAVREATKGVTDSSDYQLLTLKQLKSGVGPEGAIPDRLRKLVQVLEIEVDGDFYFYKRKGQPHYVVIADKVAELPPSRPDARDKLEDIAKLVRTSRDEGFTLNFIADAPILEQKLPIFKTDTLSRAAQRETEHEQGVAALKDAFADVLSTHTLGYNMDSIRETFWTHISTHKKPFVDYLKNDMQIWEKSGEWKEVVDAALAGDRVRYDAAFDVLARRPELMATKK